MSEIHLTSYRTSEIPVYNLTRSDLNPITMKELREYGTNVVLNKYPFEMTLWYPGGISQENRLIHKIHIILFHWIPAYIIDFIMLLIGQRRL